MEQDKQESFLGSSGLCKWRKVDLFNRTAEEKKRKNHYLEVSRSPMGGACSRKRNVLDEDDLRRSGRFSKTGSSKWLLFSQPRCSTDVTVRRQGKCPSLMELCVVKIREVPIFHHAYKHVIRVFCVFRCGWDFKFPMLKYLGGSRI